jgi:hypothetical protein
VGAREKDPPVLDSGGVVKCPSSRSLLAHGAMLGPHRPQRHAVRTSSTATPKWMRTLSRRSARDRASADVTITGPRIGTASPRNPPAS